MIVLSKSYDFLLPQVISDQGPHFDVLYVLGFFCKFFQSYGRSNKSNIIVEIKELQRNKGVLKLTHRRSSIKKWQKTEVLS